MIAEQGNTPSVRAEHQWQLQSEEVDGALARNGIHAGSVTGKINTSSLTYNIRTQVNLGYAKLRAVAEDLVQTLRVKEIGTRVVDGGLQLEIPRSADAAVPLLDLLARHEEIPTFSAALGLAEDGGTILHRFDSRDTPHLLVAGGHNAGKTAMLRSAAVSLALSNRQSEIQLAAVCPLSSDEERQRVQAASWLPLNYLPHMLCDVAFRHTDIIALLTFLSQEITYREKHSFAVPHLIVLIDQVDILIARGGRQCAEPILRLAQKGEDVGMHLVLSSASIDSAAISTQLSKEISTRLIGRPDEKQPDRDGPVSTGSNAAQLLGEGDFLFRQGGVSTRIQGAFVDDYDLHLKLTEMYRHKAILLAQPRETRVRLKQPVQAPLVAAPTSQVVSAVAVAD